MVVVPADTAVSLPADDTVATAGFDEVHLSDFIIASSGNTVGLKCPAFPTGHLIVFALSLRLVTALPTVTAQVALRLLPSVVAQVMVVLPTDFAVSLPADDTVATVGFDDVQLKVFEAPSGVTVGLKCPLLPTAHLIVAALSLSVVAFSAADAVIHAENAIIATKTNANILFDIFIIFSSSIT